MQVTDLVLTKVDRLGFLNEQIKHLTEEAETLKNELKGIAQLQGGTRSFAGQMFTATYTGSNRNTTDYKKLFSDLGISADVIARYARTTAVFSIKTAPL